MAGTATELERLVVRLVGEGSGYDKVLKDAVVKTEKAAKSIGALTEKEMAAHNRAMQEAARITEAVATPTQRYAKELETLEHLYKEGHISQETYNRALKQTTAALPSVQKAQAAHNEELRKAKAITDNARTPTEQYRQKLAEVERLYRKGLLSGTTYHRTLQSLNKEFTKGSFAVGAFGKKLTSAGRSMRMFGMMATAAVTLPVVGMIAAYGKFDSEMTKSTAIMGHMTAGLRKGMEETAESISRNSVTAATELAKAYFYLASAGMDAQQSIAALPVVEKFAVAGAFDMAQATDLLTDAQSALGLSSKDAQQNMAGMLKVSDALVKANTLANATVEQFSSALTNEAGAAIKQFNLGLEEGVAILATYADQGLKANSAGSMFARMIRLLVKSIKDNQEVFDRLNINTEEFATTGKNVTEVIRGITEATAGMGPVQKAATLEMLGFEARIQQAILPLLGLTDKIRGYEQELMKAGGITQDVADKQLASFSSQMKILWNQIKGVGREIGSYLAPHVKTLGKAVSSSLEWWRGLNEQTREAVALMTGLAAIVGPLTFGIGGLTIAVGALTTAFGALGMAGFASILAVSKWLVVLGVFAGATALATEALFKVKGGFLDFVNSVRVDGMTIGTRMRILTSYIWELWDTCVSKLKIAWDSFAYSAEEACAKVYRATLRMAKGVAYTASLLPGVGKENVEFYQNLIDESLDKSEKRWKEYHDEVERLEREGAKNAENWAKVRHQNFVDDMKAAQEDAVATLHELAAADLEEISSGYDAAAAAATAKEWEKVNADMEALLEEEKRLEGAAKSLTEEMRTPLEIFEDQVAKLNELWDAGLIGVETYNRAIMQYRNQLEQTFNKLGELPDSEKDAWNTNRLDKYNKGLRDQFRLLKKLTGKAQTGKMQFMAFGAPKPKASHNIWDLSKLTPPGAPTFGVPSFGVPTLPHPGGEEMLGGFVQRMQVMLGRIARGPSMREQELLSGRLGRMGDTYGEEGLAGSLHRGGVRWDAQRGLPRFTGAPENQWRDDNVQWGTNVKRPDDWNEAIQYLRQIAQNTGHGTPALAV